MVFIYFMFTGSHSASHFEVFCSMLVECRGSELTLLSPSDYHFIAEITLLTVLRFLFDLR